MNTNTIQALLEISIKLNGGSLKALEACEHMYSQMFRSEPYSLSDFIKLNPELDSDEIKDVYETLYSEMATACYSASDNAIKFPSAPTFNFDSDDEQFDYIIDAENDHYYEQIEEYTSIAVKWFKLNFPEFEINASTEVVDFCNYKGEGEGDISLFAINKNLPVFISKCHSFYQVNC